MLVLMGRTCSGKNAIAEELKKMGYSQLVTYTSRPIRDGEIEDATYHYLTLDEFIEKKNAGFFAEYKEYYTVNGLWMYGTGKDDIENADDNTFCILTPDGYEAIRDKKNLFAVHITVSDQTVLDRQKIRNDNVIEAKRRFAADKKDFENVSCDWEVLNDGVSVKEVAQEISTVYKFNVENRKLWCV